MVTSFHVHQPPLFLQPLRLLLKTITLHPPSKSCPWDALTSGSGPSLPIQDWGKGGGPGQAGAAPFLHPSEPFSLEGAVREGKALGHHGLRGWERGRAGFRKGALG